MPRMMRQFELVERVRAYDPDADEDVLNRAYVFGISKHGDQKRQSGDPYFSHPLEVAGILTGIKADTSTIVTAMLHDTLEDTHTTMEELTAQFGREIADLVNGVTKLSKFELQSEQTKQAENFRKFMLAMSDDARVLLVKLADRLHNMRTLHHIKAPEKRRRIAQETLDIYAPLAGRMGMQTFREELEDLAFVTLYPEIRESILRRLETLRAQNGDRTEEISLAVKLKMSEEGLECSVSGREKKPFSIWRKMEESKIGFEALTDIFAFRVVVKTVADCYRALGIAHAAWKYVPGRFKDYISLPKSNNYRSLHTTVIGPGNQRVELQIRTPDMHEIADHGIAAHWAYKDDRSGQAASVKAYDSLRGLIESMQQGDTPEEFLENTKLELFQDQVFCFTPKGLLIQLPRGATPIDFAYAVHTDVGDTTVGAKINGRHMPLSTALKNGDQVEIIRSPKQGPSAAWEQMVATGKARSAIKRYLRAQQRDELARMGRMILEKTVADTGHAFSEKALTGALKKLKLAKPEDIYVLLGEGAVTAPQVLEAIFPDYQSAGTKAKAATIPKPAPSIPIHGLVPGLAFQIAPCCLPMPGDRIVGISQAGKGVTIHTIDCAQLHQFEDSQDRWLDLRWDENAAEDTTRVGRIHISMPNEPGALANACSVIARHDGNIANLKITGRTALLFDMQVDVEVRDARHIMNIINALKANPQVANADRVSG